MKRLLLALPWPLVALLAGCPAVAPLPDQSSDGGDSDAFPDTEACAGAATACLQGTAATRGFTVAAHGLEAVLFEGYPATGATNVAKVIVARDGTWAFSNLHPSTHYFVQVLADFGQAVAAPFVVGPVSIPSSGAPIAIQVPPVQLSVLQEQQTSGMQLVSAQAYVFDPANGKTAAGATVTLDVGGVPQPLAAAGAAYALTLPAGTPAQASYTFTTSLADAGAPTAWQLTAPAGSLAPAVTVPANGASVDAGAWNVTWPPSIGSDAEVVTLYTPGDGGWTPGFQAWLDAAQTSATIPMMGVAPGAVLVNVEFLLGSCAPAADGCVASAFVASSQITVR